MTVYDPFRHHRRSIRLRGYDYERCGVYFVTVCTKDRWCMFGEVVDGVMHLNDAGQLVADTWNALPMHYPGVVLDEMQVMPNHMHGNIVLAERGRPLPEIVRGLKTFSARRINERRGTPGTPVWQRNYYERIVRDDEELFRSRAYIRNNPRDWVNDPDNPWRP